MKKLLLSLVISIISIGTFANSPTVIKQSEVNVGVSCFKKFDITIQAGGYTIHIVGNISGGLFGSNISMSGTITITGNGTNINLPFTYNGPLNAHRGVPSNNLAYDDSGIDNDVKPATEFLIHSIKFENGSGASLDFMDN
jgi:hypothetical protein